MRGHESGKGIGGKGEEVMLQETLLVEFQVPGGDLGLESFSHFLLMEEFLRSWRTDLVWLWGRDIKDVSLGNGGLHYIMWLDSPSWTAREPAEINLSFTGYWIRESVRTVDLHDRDNNFRYACCTNRCVSRYEVVVILWEIGILPLKVLPLSKGRRKCT